MTTLLLVLTATAAVFVSWIVLAICLTGVGLGLRRAFGLRVIGGDRCLMAMWMGFAATILLLQIWHFVFPVTGWAMSVLAVLGVLGLAWNREELGRWIRRVSWRDHAVTIVVLLVTLLWLANRATGSPNGQYDTGMYHYPVVKWTSTYPLVPGIANLHGRLAYNNSHLLFAAALGVGPWSGREFHLANGFLFAAIFLQILWSGFRLLRAPAGRRSRYLFDLVLLAPAADLMIGPDVSSLATDPIPGIVMWVLASSLFALMTRTDLDEQERAWDLVTIATLSVAAVCLKVSAVGVSSGMWILAVILGLKATRNQRALRRRVFGWIVSITLLLGLTWTARGVVMSGYPVFPSTAFPFPVSWRVPAEQGNADRAYIQWYARHYYSKYSQWSPRWGVKELQAPWFRPWLHSLPYERQLYMVVPSLLTVLAWGFVARRRLQGHWVRPPNSAWVVLLPALVGAIFWLVTAPNPRFGTSTFWIIAATSVAYAVYPWIENAAPKSVAVLTMLAVVAGNWPIIRPVLIAALPPSAASTQAVARALFADPGSDHGFGPIAEEPLDTFTSSTGLTMYYPRDSNRCWSAPLPCTPYPTPNLSLRRDGDLSSGFETDGKWEQERWPNQKSRFLEMWRASRAGGRP